MNRRKEIAESDTEDDGTAPPKRVRRAYYSHGSFSLINDHFLSGTEIHLR